MFRNIRYALIVGSLSLAFFLLAAPSEASECSLFFPGEAAACILESEPENNESVFATPEAIDDSLFGERFYARLADNANVYPGPGQGAPVRKIHRIPLITSRRSLHGRPRRSARTGSLGRMELTSSHCLSVRSIHNNYTP